MKEARPIQIVYDLRREKSSPPMKMMHAPEFLARIDLKPGS